MSNGRIVCSISAVLGLVLLVSCSSQTATVTATFTPQREDTPIATIATPAQQALTVTIVQATVPPTLAATSTGAIAVQSDTAASQQSISPMTASTLTPPRPVSSPTPASTFYGVGVVTKIDPAFPAIELKHEEIKGYMPAMTMEYFVRDKSLLQGIQIGERVTFTIHDQGGTPMITELKP